MFPLFEFTVFWSPVKLTIPNYIIQQFADWELIWWWRGQMPRQNVVDCRWRLKLRRQVAKDDDLRHTRKRRLLFLEGRLPLTICNWHLFGCNPGGPNNSWWGSPFGSSWRSSKMYNFWKTSPHIPLFNWLRLIKHLKSKLGVSLLHV